MYQYYNYAELFKPEEVIDYLRKSRTDDPTLTVEEVLEKHEVMLDDWSEKNLGEKVPQENKFYEVVSGETIKERPEFQKVLKMIESPKYKAIKVVEVQRLSRGDLEDAGRLIKLLRFTNTYVITPPKTYDLRDEYDRDAFERELKRGNEYLEYTKKIMKNGKDLSIAQGNYIYSIPPYGFDKTVILDGKRKCPTLKENKEQADIVRMIFDMYVNQNMGRTAICYRLDDLGVKPPKGKHWAPTAVREMLKNVHYIGKVKQNWRRTETLVEDGEIIKKRPVASVSEQIIYEGKHEAIISEELFNAAADKMGRNHKATSKAKLRNPFATLIYCKNCGRVVVLQMFYTKNSAPRLLCAGQSRCGNASCLYEEFESQMKDILKQCIEDFEIKIENNEGESVKLHSALIKQLEKTKAELEKKELAQWEQQAHPDPAQRMPAEIFKKLNEKLLQEKEENREALCRAYESMPEPVNYEEKIIKFQNALNTLCDPKASPEEKNKLLKDCIDRIEYYRAKPERISLKGKGTFPMTASKWTNPTIELDIKLRV